MITLGFSPCPNDTFIFDALVHHKVDTEGLTFEPRMDDVETLNHLAMQDMLEMVKISYHAFLYLSDRYEMLNSGSAIGFGAGPLLISNKDYSIEDLPNLTVAVPGEYTTAHLLLKLAAPSVKKKKIMVFHEIEDALLSGVADAGVIIHENRFTYEQKGLKKILDLGEYWENLTHSPIPLGGIAVKKSLGTGCIAQLNRIMRRSVVYAQSNPDDVMGFVRGHAQEMDEAVMKKHIALYVNKYTTDFGAEGKMAVEHLFSFFGKQCI
jgi:1,4-dihydroxy-6-naphthoate synthase